ncbi:MAG TPA: E3 binding domain-containing protein, partial [Yinghuangia sp.]|nr:E3 binding domain-containing protein [Yinghuangia sp.]
MPEFTMPSLGADMDEGTLTEWLVHEGDTVRRGDVVAVVDTAKSAIEVECFDSGTVTDLLVSPGQTVPVGTPMAVISSTEERPLPKAETPPATETTPKGPAAKAATGGTDHVGPEPSVPVEDASATSSPLVRHLADELGVPLGAVQGSGPGGRVTRADVREAAHTDARPDVSGRRRPAASPLARRLARELGVDLNSVHGSGKNGVIRADDVRAAAHPEPPPGTATAAEHVEEPGRVRAPEADGAATMRSAIAGLMSRAKREIPHYYLATTTDVARAVEWTHAYNRGRPVGEHVLPTALLLKAVAVAARQVPELNGFW